MDSGSRKQHQELSHVKPSRDDMLTVEEYTTIIEHGYESD